MAVKQIETARTRLRRFDENDLENMMALESDPGVVKYTPARVPLSREQSQERLKNLIERQKSDDPLGIWAAENKMTGEFIGWFMLLKRENEHPELGFMLVQTEWNKGFASEIAGALKKYAFEDLNFKRLLAKTDPQNLASIRVLEKIGFYLVRFGETNYYQVDA